MNRLALIASFLVPGMAHAVICKTVDADGVVAYTDVPAHECQSPVKLPPNSTYAPRQLPASNLGKRNDGEVGDKVGFNGYESIKIVQPEANGTVRSNKGKVPVVIALVPELQTGHRIKVFIDGGAVPGEFSGTSIELSGVERGTHTVRAVVSDAKGKRLGDSPSVRFTLRQPGLLDNALPETPENPIEPPPVKPGFPAPGDKPNYKPGTPNYSPNPAPNAATPGQTNPAFKPNFRAR